MKNVIENLLRRSAPITEKPVVLGDFDKGVDAYNKGDYETAFNEFCPIAEQGDAEAQYNFGQLYREQEGDYQQAIKWYRLSAEQGFADAQYNLGMLYNKGIGVLQDYSEALRWYKLAAEQGFADAQNNLGAMYKNGWGVPQDYSEAIRLCILSAKQGNANSHSLIWGLCIKMDGAFRRTMFSPTCGLIFRGCMVMMMA